MYVIDAARQHRDANGYHGLYRMARETQEVVCSCTAMERCAFMLGCEYGYLQPDGKIGPDNPEGANMNVKGITLQHLTTNNFGGLYNEDECDNGCTLGDLMPCSSCLVENCKPGYLQPDGSIGPDKLAATDIRRTAP